MVKLCNGYEIPDICFGTDIVDYEVSPSKRIKIKAKNIVKKYMGKDVKKYNKDQGIVSCCRNSLKNGCKFFDTSRAYGGSERMLRECLKGLDRDKYFICTKLDNYSQIHNVAARNVLESSMEQLGIEYVDLYLLHWPVEGKFLEYWKQLEELYKDGRVKAIGVSNCKIHHLEDIKAIAEIMPMVNEVELHPLLSEIELRNYCRQRNIQIMAYTSTARLDFRLVNSRRMKLVCDQTGKSLSQIILRWHIQNGIIPIFNTSTVEHFKENMDVFGFELTENQMKIIDSMNINARTRYDSDNCEWECL